AATLNAALHVTTPGGRALDQIVCGHQLGPAPTRPARRHRPSDRRRWLLLPPCRGREFWPAIRAWQRATMPAMIEHLLLLLRALRASLCDRGDLVAEILCFGSSSRP